MLINKYFWFRLILSLKLNYNNKTLQMQSSIEFGLRRQNNIIKKLDFYKDILMPNIYSNQNFQLVKNNRYTPRKQRKVITAKKAKVHQVIQGIVSKKHLQVSTKIPHYNHRLSKPYITSKRKSLTTFNYVKPDALTMDIDEGINQRAIYYEEQSSAVKQKIKETMEKIAINTHLEHKKKEQINFYLTQLSPRQKSNKIKKVYVTAAKVPNPSLKQVKGYVQQHQQIQNKRELRNKKQINTVRQTTIKSRPKTADNLSKRKMSQQKIQKQQKSIILRSNSLLNTKLSRFQIGREVLQNMKMSRRNSVDKDKMQNILDSIESNCLQQSLTKSNMINSLNKLSMLWKSQKQFLDDQNTHHILEITNQTLDLVKTIRKRQNQLKQLDDKFIKNQKSNKKY